MDAQLHNDQGASRMTPAEARWRAARTQHLLSDGVERFEAMATVRAEAKAQPWVDQKP